MDTLKTIAISDIHLGPNMTPRGDKKPGCKLGSWAPTLLDMFHTQANAFNPDAIVNLGDDFLAHQTLATPQQYVDWRTQLDLQFNRFSIPVLRNVGNHDACLIERLNDPEGFPSYPDSCSIEINGYRIIAWNPEILMWKAKEISAGERHKDWLKRKLDSSNIPTIITKHAPARYYQDQEEITDIFSNHGNVILAISGHEHRPDKVTVVDEIPYFVQHSFTERQDGAPLPWGAYSEICVDPTDIKITRRNIMAPCTDDRQFIIPRRNPSAFTTVNGPLENCTQP